ncbi:MAG: 50S ribosomal protein L11 methyltransferase [Gammaproteobacteria bacterium]
MPWLQLRIELGGRDPAPVEDALHAAGAFAVTLDDARDDPIYEPPPGELPLWPSTRLTGLFPGDADRAILAASLENALGPDPLPVHEFTALDDRTWEREWLKDFKPMRFGKRLWVIPGEHEAPDPRAINLELDPGLAFGTGTHATTALCLVWLDGLDLKGKRVVDYGCGSGILAVAAALLGAAEVLAVDNDPQALIATRENAERNGVGHLIATPRASLPRSPLPLETPFVGDILVANILAAPLIALAPRFAALTARGALVAVSGLLERQAEEVRAAYASWCALDETGERDGWVRLSGTKR